MTIDSADDLKILNRTINTNRISNRTYDSKSNRITKLRRSLVSSRDWTHIITIWTSKADELAGPSTIKFKSLLLLSVNVVVRREP